MVRHPSIRRRNGAARMFFVALAVSAPAAVAISTSSPVQAEDPADPTVSLVAPDRIVVESYNGRVWSDLGLRVKVADGPLEIWSQRPSYSQPVVTTVKKPSGDVTLPTGRNASLGEIDRFVRLTFTSLSDPGAAPFVRRIDACLGTESFRTDPDGAFKSPYPRGCYYNPYSIGAVQGIPAGWSGTVGNPYEGTRMRLAPGRYKVQADIAGAYADALGLTADQRSEVLRVVVKKVNYDDECRGECRRTSGTDPDLTPAHSEPTGPGVGSADALPDGTPVPDLRSLPAFGIEVNRKGTQLRFAANVWNGGTGDLVVDGFRRGDRRIMDAYQYFIDSDGHQVAYEPVGTMEWDPAPTHQHWHFTDFATYRLLKADRTRAVRSGKEAFCLANTDAVDLTGEGANWSVGYDDLGSVCGGLESESIREVLAAGWGDTYAQYRAGQAFPIKNLPDGVYFIEVAANPENNLIESDTTNNTSLRKIKLRTNARGERKVKVFPVGIINENGLFGGY